MRIRTTNEQGSALLVSLATASLIGITLAAYLNLVSAQNTSILRSQAWNGTMPVLEAGVEEALTHLYHNGMTNLAINGWIDGGDQYSKFRKIGDGWVFVTISNINPPVIYARGYASVPLQRYGFVERTVKVDTRRDSLFAKGIVAQGEITLNGNNVVVDSFDSIDPNSSSNGLYVASKRKANGGLASNSGVTNIISTGNADIAGKVSTGPGGSVGIGPNGKIGDLGWQTNSSGIQPGTTTDDMNVAFPDVQQPFVVAAAPPSGTGAYSSYEYVISSSGNYEIPSLTHSLLVRSNASVVLLVDGDINLTGQDQIQIEPGGTLHVYMKGDSAKFAGNGIVNQQGNATNFFYWGLPSNTKVSISGNGSLTGVIYAPTANLTIDGNGSGEQIVGATVTATATVNGDFQFHYDENVGRLAYSRGFIPVAWNEISN
jgi:hypothetical protein